MILFLKAHIATYTRTDGTMVAAHEDHRRVMLRRPPRSAPAANDDFDDDMADQVAWLSERARNEGYVDVDDMLERDPTLFARLAVSWREQHPRLAKALSMLMKAGPTSAQAEAGNYKKPRRQWKGLEIAIENPVGSVREGKGWRTKMQNAYGYVCRSEGVDGDEVDMYLGPELDTAPMVYVVHQRKAGDWEAYDEDKVMIGFTSEAAARAAYLAHYDDPRFLGPITAMTAGDFINKVRATYDKPAMIKALVFLK